LIRTNNTASCNLDDACAFIYLIASPFDISW